MTRTTPIGRRLTSPTRWHGALRHAAVPNEGSFGTRAGDQPKTILIVDDEEDARDFLRVAFGGSGYRCIEASSGAQALMLIDEQPPQLLIVDIMMPGMTGIELCAQLRDRRDTWHIPIIVYSAHPMQSSHWGLYERAFMKPADVDAMLRAVDALIPVPRA
jgi:CheY-like chemotaxis protein